MPDSSPPMIADPDIQKAFVFTRQMQNWKLSEEKQSIINKHLASFRQVLGDWRLFKDDPRSPKLNAPEMKELYNIMITGFTRVIDYLERARQLPEEYKSYVRTTRAIGLSLMEKDLLDCPAIRNYRGNRKEAVFWLFGATVKRALDAAVAAGIILAEDRQEAIPPHFFIDDGKPLPLALRETHGFLGSEFSLPPSR